MLDYHRSLLADTTRVTAFRDAIRRVVRPGDVVADLGAGTGVLTFFACEAGARRVYAIEREHLADVAAFLARHLELGDRVTVLHQLSTDVALPEPANVIVAELIGACGLDENILSYVIDARSRFLAPGGAIVPRALALHAAAVELPERHQRHLDFWNEPLLGFDFSPLRVFASNSIHLLRIPLASQLTPDARWAVVDLQSVASTLVTGNVETHAERDGVVHGFAVWFTATLSDGIELTNRDPELENGSWAQAFLPLEESVHVTAGTPVAFEIQSDDGKAWRWRGRIGETPFDQTTWLNRPPCFRQE